MQEMIAGALHRMLHGMDLASILVGAFLFLLFVLFFTIGLRARGRFFRFLYFLLSVIFLFGIPPAIVYSSKYYFHKIEITYNHSRPLMYSNSFLIDIGFRNNGKLALNKCLITIIPKRKVQNLLNKIRDTLNPMAYISYPFSQKIPVGKSYEVSKILPYQYKKYDFNFEINCR